MKLPDYFSEAIISISDDELGELYSRFRQDKGQTDLIDFARHLYLKDFIKGDELKKIENQKRIEFTALANVKDIDHTGFRVEQDYIQALVTIY